ncbi:MAG: hypothetical protein Q8P56_02680 [Candidatus Uhrbacteria bacterium]|nr:hypothetical protein [Candidatus Uhrbacteria bacterium]
MESIHKDLAEGRWFQMTAMEQMGNIGSEVERSLRWHKKNETENRDKAIERMLDLIDLTVRDPKWIHRLKELLRTREVLCDYFFGDNTFSISPEALQKEFLYYGIAARADK